MRFPLCGKRAGAWTCLQQGLLTQPAPLRQQQAKKLPQHARPTMQKAHCVTRMRRNWGVGDSYHWIVDKRAGLGTCAVTSNVGRLAQQFSNAAMLVMIMNPIAASLQTRAPHKAPSPARCGNCKADTIGIQEEQRPQA